MADFFPTGPIDLFIAERRPYVNWYYLGSAIGSPEIEITKFARDLRCDRSGDAPWQKVATSEVHHLMVTLNRINFGTLNRIRTRSQKLTTYTLNPGNLIYFSTDFQLFIRYSVPGPAGAPSGRLYFSAYYAGGTEAQPEKVQEVGVVFSCNPIWDATVKPKTFFLYTEDVAHPSWPEQPGASSLVLE